METYLVMRLAKPSFRNSYLRDDYQSASIHFLFNYEVDQNRTIFSNQENSTSEQDLKAGKKRL